MKVTSRKIMQSIASFTELVLSAFLIVVIMVMIIKLIIHSCSNLWAESIELTYYLECAMTLAIGIEFVKMLCMHTLGAVIEVLLFAIARQMIVQHLSAVEILIGVVSIAGLFAIRKYLLGNHDDISYKKRV